ncbi:MULTISPECIES: hypothetical protein [unclassified Lysinibacillus]|uniref:hypothetical protein n=1 Tax=unclassified Lysinibacillus TaxID=2636778 RepID=UPI0025544DE3|nr:MULTISPECIES: hypothetical protein [unclassified Lysinibacillus]MDM5249524.1 hypothetical protein [Lysinibacillus sp. G4S2]
MKKIGMYIGITVMGIIAVFAGNLLFTEYQSYKLEKEIEKLEKEQEEKELAEAKELALRNIKFDKPIIMQNEDKWELVVTNQGNQNISGFFYVKMYDEDGKEILREFVSIPAGQLSPYGEFIYKGEIDKEYKNKVHNYKILDAELYAREY